MTLDTRIAIRGIAPYSARQVFDYCRGLINTPDSVPVEAPESWHKGTKMLMNPCGIGLDGWLMMFYGPDGPLPVHEHDKYCATELDGEYDTTQEEIDAHAREVAESPVLNGWATMEVSIDTSYGFRGKGGESCSQRHARFIFELGTWLEKCGMEWKWLDEYTGEWHEGYAALEEFGGFHGSEGGPGEWFRDEVLPFIKQRIGESK